MYKLAITGAATPTATPWFISPALRVVHMDDRTTTNSPLIDDPGGGIVEWTKTLDEMRKLDFDAVIPGHRPISKKADMLTYRNNAERMRNLVPLIRQGKTQADTAKVVTAEYREWTPESLYVQWSLPGIMTELR